MTTARQGMCLWRMVLHYVEKVSSVYIFDSLLAGSYEKCSCYIAGGVRLAVAWLGPGPDPYGDSAGDYEAPVALV